MGISHLAALLHLLKTQRKWSKIHTLSIVQGSTPFKTNKEEQAPPNVLAITIR